MAFEVSNEIREQTTKCPQDFRCLNDESPGVCAAHTRVKGDGLFIEKAKDGFCPYIMPFGYSHICHCPTRCELFDRYGV